MMKKLKTFLVLSGLLLGSFGFASAATIILTNSSDTLNTFRTNVNTSLTNLNTALGSVFPFTTLSTGENATSTKIAFLGGFLSNASSTLTAFTFSTATGTSATTTNFATTGLCISGDCKTAWPTTAMSFAFPYTKQADGFQATSTGILFSGGFVASASSTANLVRISNLTSNGFVKTSGSGGLLSVDTNSYSTFPWPFTKLATNEQATSTTMVFANGLISNASSTLSSLTATTTNLAVTSNHISMPGTGYVTATTTLSFRVASTTLDAIGKGFQTGTTTLVLANFPEARTLQNFYCQASTTGSVIVRFGDGVNWAQPGNCSTTGKRWYMSSNNTFTIDEAFIVEIGTSATSPNSVSVSAVMLKTSD